MQPPFSVCVLMTSLPVPVYWNTFPCLFNRTSNVTTRHYCAPAITISLSVGRREFNGNCLAEIKGDRRLLLITGCAVCCKQIRLLAEA